MRRLPVLLAILAAGAAPAAILTVAPDGSADYATIQAALDAAQPGDVVELADGVYAGDGNVNLDPGGTPLTVRSASGDPAACVIDCQGVPGTTRRGFRFHSGEGPDFLVSGLTITGGSAAPSGAGIACTGGASPSFANCVIENGTATENGGGVYCSGGADPTFTDCVIRDNEAVFYGGALRAISASASFVRCRIEGNSTSDGNGGGLSYYWNGTPEITDCSFTGNFAHRGGGAIFLFASQATVTGCDFTGNACLNDGGAIDSVESRLTVTGCRFTANEAQEFGGAVTSGDDYSDPSGWLVMADCLLAGNTSQRGGGLHAQYSDVTLSSCTLVGNAGSLLASGLTSFWSTVAMERVIIAGGVGGAAVHCEDPADAPTILCSDLWDNEGGDWTDCIADQLGTGGNIAADPVFCDPAAGDYSLDAASPCATAPCGLMGSEAVGCDDPTGTPTTAPGVAWLLPPRPNPSGGGVTVAWMLPRDALVEVEVLTVRGERLWRAGRRAPAGPGSLRWPGRDRTDRPVAAGIYLLRLRVDGDRAGSETVVITR